MQLFSLSAFADISLYSHNFNNHLQELIVHNSTYFWEGCFQATAINLMN